MSPVRAACREDRVSNKKGATSEDVAPFLDWFQREEESNAR